MLSVFSRQKNQIEFVVSCFFFQDSDCESLLLFFMIYYYFCKMRVWGTLIGYSDSQIADFSFANSLPPRLETSFRFANSFRKRVEVLRIVLNRDINRTETYFRFEKCYRKCMEAYFKNDICYQRTLGVCFYFVNSLQPMMEGLMKVAECFPPITEPLRHYICRYQQWLISIRIK